LFLLDLTETLSYVHLSLYVSNGFRFSEQLRSEQSRFFHNVILVQDRKASKSKDDCLKAKVRNQFQPQAKTWEGIFSALLPLTRPHCCCCCSMCSPHISLLSASTSIIRNMFCRINVEDSSYTVISMGILSMTSRKPLYPIFMYRFPLGLRSW